MVWNEEKVKKALRKVGLIPIKDEGSWWEMKDHSTISFREIGFQIGRSELMHYEDLIDVFGISEEEVE